MKAHRRSRSARASRGCRPSGAIPLPLLFALSSLAIASLLAFPLAAQQQSPGTITGTVTDTGGDPVTAVMVTLTGLAGTTTVRATLTDSVGRYRFPDVVPGRYELRARRLGLAETVDSIAVAGGQLVAFDLRLVEQAVRLDGVLVETTADRERARFETQAGVTARVVEASTIRLLPGLAEPDVLRAVAILPGVITTSDFSSSYNVRGGSADQNLIALDGFTVFNPFHLGGLFSVFNSDAIERAELLSGGFGAEYGGRVSSVLNIESRTDVPDELAVDGGISVLASRLLLRAPMPGPAASLFGGDSGSWFFSARRSYFDQLLRPVTDFPYHLTDLQAYAAVGTAGGGRVALTAYRGDDVLDLSRLDLSDAGDVLRFRWDWGNRVIGTTWEQPLPAGWSIDARVGYSGFSEEMAFVDFGDIRLASEIDQLLARADFHRDFSASLAVTGGLAVERTDHMNLAYAGGTTFFASDGTGVLGSAHASLSWAPDRWLIEPGVRAEVWRVDTASRQVVSPRLAVKRFLGVDRNLAVKLAAGRYAQYVHSLRDQDLPISNDTWILANESIPPVISDQVQLGVEAFFSGGWSASAEAYARDFDGVVEFNLTEDPNDPADDLLEGTGQSYGLDLMLKRSAGPLTGWVALSLLRAERSFPDPVAAEWEELPKTVTYPPIFDRRVNLDFTAQYRTANGFELGARWNFGSGLPYTRPIAQHFAFVIDPRTGLIDRQSGGGSDPDDNGIPAVAVLGPRNADRYPAYHRLDLTVRRPFVRGWGGYTPYFQLLNAYNRRNVLFYFFDYDRTPPVRSGFSMFPMLPALGVEVSF